MLTREQYTTGEQVRLACRTEHVTGQTSGMAPGFVQANLVVVPQQYADAFRQYCERNPRPCPLLEVTGPGDRAPAKVAAGADLSTDLPRYRVWRYGSLMREPTSISDLWQDDFVSFIFGCSFTFEAALIAEGINVRHIQLERNVPMYRTNIACQSAGPFAGHMVVSMRPIRHADVQRAGAITSAFPRAHGAPVHRGSPDAIGIKDLHNPDFGDAVPVEDDEIPVFWACGVTPQVALMDAGLPLAITHCPGSMLVTDLRDDQIRERSV